MATAAELYNLQKIDTMWLQVRRRLQQVQRMMGEGEALQRPRQQVTETEEKLHTWHGRQTDSELEAQTLNERIASTDNRLMSGQVTNPKELESLQASTDALRRQLVSVEESGVEALLEVEALTTQLADEQKTLAETEEQWQSGQGVLLEEENKMKRNYVILKRKREAAVEAMDEASVKEYERLRQRKAGIAVAAIEGESCGACNVKLPTGVISAATNHDRLTSCPSCGRILFDG